MVNNQIVNIESKAREVMKSLEGLTFTQWKVIERKINLEYQRLANKNTLISRECLIKNVLQDLSASSVKTDGMNETQIILNRQYSVQQLVQETRRNTPNVEQN